MVPELIGKYIFLVQLFVEAGERGLAVRSNLRARYAGSAALAVLTRFAPDPNGSLYFYVFKTDGTAWRAGDTRLPYIDPRDGLAHAALPYLVGADEDSGCAEVLMRLLPALEHGESY